jgi:ParB-like chromosome segregation protein Spo0J
MKLSLITIDPDFRDYFPPLESDAYEALKDKIIHEGFTDPVKLWSVGYNNYLLDGHHRYQICKELGIEPRHVFIKCADKKAALEWIRENQRARRNTTTYRIIEQYLAEKAAIAEQAKLNQQKALKRGNQPPVCSNSNKRENEPIDSLKEAATKAGVGRTQFYEGSVVDASNYDDIKGKARSGEMSVHAAYKEVKRRDAEKAKQEKPDSIKPEKAVKPKKEEVPDWAKDIDVSAELEAAAPTLEQIVEDQQREISQLQELLESFKSEDSAKEIRKWEQIATNARREADTKANRLASFQRQLSQQRPIMQFLYEKHGNVTPAKLLSLLKDVYGKAEGL